MDSAILKIQRAETHYTEFEKLLTEHKPFRYFLETNLKLVKRLHLRKEMKRLLTMLRL